MKKHPTVNQPDQYIGTEETMSDAYNKLIDEDGAGVDPIAPPGVNSKGTHVIVDENLPPLQAGRYITLNWLPDTKWVVLSVGGTDMMLGNTTTREFLCVRTWSTMYKILDELMEYSEVKEFAKTIDLTSYNIAINNLGPMEHMAKHKYMGDKHRRFHNIKTRTQVEE